MTARWTYPSGRRATTRCVNGTPHAREHMISNDGTRCLACGAVREIVLLSPEPAPAGAVTPGRVPE